MTITIADGRGALWQWDTGRRVKITDGADVKQIHYQNRCFGCSVDVDVGTDGTAIIPDELLQDCHTLTAYAYVTDDTGAYTMVQQDFAVHKRAKPAGYVYTPTEQMTLQTIQRQIGDLADLTTEAKENLVAAINEAAASGGAGSMGLRVADGYIQYSTDSGSTWQNLIAVAELKGADGSKGDPGIAGQDGHSPVVTATKSGKTTTISVDGAAIATVEDGADGAPGSIGADGITPTIGQNGNWYLGEEDTGKPSRGAIGAPGKDGNPGAPGKDGKSAYQYAQEGGYTGTETAFAEKLAQEQLTGTTNELTPTHVYNAVSAGIPVKVQYTDSTYGLSSFTAFNVSESMNVIASNAILNYQNTYLLAALYGDKSTNGWFYEVTPLAKPSDIPSALPNPNALKFTGAVTGSYNGSAALTVNIPSAVTDTHINSLIDTKLGVIENGAY